MSRCMVLNASYEFLTIEERWIDALGLVLAGKAVPLEEYPDVVRSQHCSFRLPAVVMIAASWAVMMRSSALRSWRRNVAVPAISMRSGMLAP